jgi:hypothetical protein
MARRVSGEIDVLFSVRPQEFVRERTAVSARLREAGRTAEAAEVKRLRKPTPATWAINQVARQDPEGIRRFIEAVDRLRRAHVRGGTETPEAVEEQRSSLHRLVTRANSVITTGGLRWSAELARRISMTLVGAAADRQARENLRGGRIVSEHSAPGFEALASTPLRLRLLRGGRLRASEGPHSAQKPSSSEKKGLRSARRQIRHDREEIRAAREAVRVAERELRDWRRRAAELDRAAAAHGRVADKAERTAKELAARLRELEQTVARERQSAAQASREAARAREEAARATARVEAASLKS